MTLRGSATRKWPIEVTTKRMDNTQARVENFYGTRGQDQVAQGDKRVADIAIRHSTLINLEQCLNNLSNQGKANINQAYLIQCIHFDLGQTLAHATARLVINQCQARFDSTLLWLG
eukprot:m.199567 g.199567  ORF g.199567 m.199567 type:complete len:116 (+) comp17043_c0_seq68:2786-3133(+)